MLIVVQILPAIDQYQPGGNMLRLIPEIAEHAICRDTQGAGDGA
jgi:hypothetical protein